MMIRSQGPRSMMNPPSCLWNPQSEAEWQRAPTVLSICICFILVFANKHGQPTGEVSKLRSSQSITFPVAANLEEASCLHPSQRRVQAHHLLLTPGFVWPSHCSLQENSRDAGCLQNQGFRAGSPPPLLCPADF